jgi:hypothetical protein
VESCFIVLHSSLEHHDAFCPEVQVDFVPAQSLKFVFPLVKIFEFFLQAVPETLAYLRRKSIVSQVLRNLDKIDNLVLEREGLNLVKHIIQD